MMSLLKTIIRNYSFHQKNIFLSPIVFFSIRNCSKINVSKPLINSCFNFTHLKTKSFLSISGPESIDFLQGLITNDARHLIDDDGSTSVKQPCIYAFILNNAGRIIADIFVYKFPSDNDGENMVLLEIDDVLRNNLGKFLKKFKIKRKVSVKNTDDYQSYVMFPDIAENCKLSTDNLDTLSSNLNDKTTIITLDPRNSHLGFKMISSDKSFGSNDNTINCLNENFKISKVSEDKYRLFRYQYGIAEGMIDFPPESSFPLEANGDILNGISFNKGCYVGQEMTTRIYHTGVIRKRIMPVKISVNAPSTVLLESLPMQSVVDQEGITMGRFRSNFDRQGLAVLKFDDISSDIKLKLSLNGLSLRTWRPFWWPESLVEQSKKS